MLKNKTRISSILISIIVLFLVGCGAPSSTTEKTANNTGSSINSNEDNNDSNSSNQSDSENNNKDNGEENDSVIKTEIHSELTQEFVDDSKKVVEYVQSLMEEEDDDFFPRSNETVMTYIYKMLPYMQVEGDLNEYDIALFYATTYVVDAVDKYLKDEQDKEIVDQTILYWEYSLRGIGVNFGKIILAIEDMIYDSDSISEGEIADDEYIFISLLGGNTFKENGKEALELKGVITEVIIDQDTSYPIETRGMLINKSLFEKHISEMELENLENTEEFLKVSDKVSEIYSDYIPDFVDIL